MKHFKCFFVIFLLCMSFGFADTVNSQSKIKKYISIESLTFVDGQLLVIEDDFFFKPDAIYQDDLGLFIRASWFGDCPNGHPYSGPDGGCTGPSTCPYS